MIDSVMLRTQVDVQMLQNRECWLYNVFKEME